MQESPFSRNAKAMRKFPKMESAPPRPLEDDLSVSRPANFQNERAVKMQIVEVRE